jgi:glutamate-1-semialdehyde 2,1-aminomutase
MNSSAYPASINRVRMQDLFKKERENFASRMPKSKELSQRAAQHLLFGVPLHWMNDWSTPFTLYVEQAKGAQLTDVDGNLYTDFCLGDTGAMFGHSPEPVARALKKNADMGFTTMLPTQNSVLVAEELASRFNLPYWQFALTATDANRFVLRWARAATSRKKILVFNGCYHGTVDDTFVDIVEGRPQQRDSLLGQVHDIKLFTEVIEFNDLMALEKALSNKDIACVLAEPVMTNVGMVTPQPGYWEKAQEIISSNGTLLAIDETHTISSGMNGYSGVFGIKPDLFILGKPIAGGLSGAVYGFSKDVAARAQNAKHNAPPGHSGIGTTLTANMLTMAAIYANLTEVMTAEAYKHMITVSERLANNLRNLFKKYHLPWCVTQIGARTEFQFSATPPLNGTEASNIMDSELEKTIHLYLLNRGIIITPFHNMMLVSPHTTCEQADKLSFKLSSLLEVIVS